MSWLQVLPLLWAQGEAAAAAAAPAAATPIDPAVRRILFWFFLSGHLLADMQDICDRIAILHRGELKELGKVNELLTVQDVTQIKTRDLSEGALAEIREVIARHHGELLAVDHPTTTLEELFLRIVRESELHPGRRKVASDGSRTQAPAPAELAGTRTSS